MVKNKRNVAWDCKLREIVKDVNVNEERRKGR